MLAPPRAGLFFVSCISKATTKNVVAHFNFTANFSDLPPSYFFA